ncbi:MAG: M81 family metallopeptidase [Deltaproteobacteria bacterium]|nr:M81 family metallopeptidase [Deltaproteobacteria bacterium]
MKSTEMGKKYRIALAGLYIETNSFAEETMGKSKITGNMTTGFQGWSADELIKEYRGSKTYMGGFIDAFDKYPEVEILPATFWSFVAGGPIAAEDYQTMKKDILDRLAKAMPLDAVALCLHGAGTAEGVEDAETDLCKAIRELVGPEAKIVSAQDHHGCLSDEDVKLLDLMTIVHHLPPCRYVRHGLSCCQNATRHD